MRKTTYNNGFILSEQYQDNIYESGFNGQLSGFNGQLERRTNIPVTFKDENFLLEKLFLVQLNNSCQIKQNELTTSCECVYDKTSVKYTFNSEFYMVTKQTDYFEDDMMDSKKEFKNYKKGDGYPSIKYPRSIIFTSGYLINRISDISISF